MTIDRRREHEAALVHHYCKTFAAAGVTGYSEERAWDDYGFAQLMGGFAVATVTAGTLDLSNERGIELVATMAERHVHTALEHDGPARLAEILKVNQE